MPQRQMLSAACATAREPQVLPFTDPATGTEVVLVACMHFNPQSAAKATTVTRNLSDRGELGVVVLESCPSRWKRIEDMQPPGSPMRALLDNEMQAAADVAKETGRPVVLGDQRIEEFMSVVLSVSRTTFLDLLSPLGGGWQRTVEEVAGGLASIVNYKQRQAAGSVPGDGIGFSDLMDTELIRGVPLAVGRYLLSIFLKAPLLLVFILGGTFAFDVLHDNPLVDVLTIIFEVAFIRIFLGAFLTERDQILARSIAEACKASAGRSVVAVLGAAHCNGVKRHLLEQDF